MRWWGRYQDKPLRQDRQGHPYRSWGQRRLPLIDRFRLALDKQDDDLAIALVESGGIDPNQWLDDGQTRPPEAADRWTWDSQVRPLHLAARRGRAELCWALIQRGADPGARTLFGNTALHMAAMAKHTILAAYLVSLGLDLDQRNSSRSHYADDSVGSSGRELLRDNHLDLEAHETWLAGVRRRALGQHAGSTKTHEQTDPTLPKTRPRAL
jgi:hypothetical protein